MKGDGVTQHIEVGLMQSSSLLSSSSLSIIIITLISAQGFGSYDKEVICNEMDSLDAKMLTQCGQNLLPSTSGYSEHCG